MITGISIENFKGIGERVDIELRPITLLFGPNSAGKSTILHALQYAHEVFERLNLNPDRTICGGSVVDLGGFQNLVHGHDLSRRIRIGLSMSITADDLEILSFAGMPDTGWRIDDYCRACETVDVALTVGWAATQEAPLVLGYEIAIDGQFVASITTDIGRPEAVLRFDAHHPMFLRTLDQPEHITFAVHPLSAEDFDADETILGALWGWIQDQEWIEGAIPVEGEGIFEVYLDQHEGALPDPDVVLPLQIATEHSSSGEAELAAEDAAAVESVIALLTQLIAGPANLARSGLADMRYLGPVRETPPRNFLPPQYPDVSRWASGLGAWDALLSGGDDLIDRVGTWLGDPGNLNAGCSLERRGYLELDLADPVVRKLVDRRAFDDVEEGEGIDLTRLPRTSRIVIVPTGTEVELRPHDVGVGISQVVPVIVTALDGESRLIAMEQPELHIHPRLQADIADLFIEAFHSNRQRFILETHSEHLILRLLRRIRETENGTAPPGRQLRTDEVGIYYLKQEQGVTTAKRIDVDVKGEFVQPWPDDFFEIDFYERFPDAR